MLVIIVGFIVVGVAWWVGNNSTNLFDPIEEKAPPATPPTSTDPCIALTVDLTNKETELAAANAALEENGNKFRNANNEIGVLTPIMLGFTAAGFALAWWNPAAAAIAFAAAAGLSFRIGQAMSDRDKAEAAKPGLQDAAAAAKDARDAAQAAFNTAGCGFAPAPPGTMPVQDDEKHPPLDLDDGEG
ncbi:MAG: hypothetical protein AAGA70_10490 [Pseudomonadota bacterium]